MVSSSPLVLSALRALRKAYRESGSRIWRRAREMIEVGRSRRVEVNLARIARHTNEGDAVLVPGKVLGYGRLDHKLVVGALDFSSTAKRSIRDAGGEALSIEEFVKRFKSGSGVKLIG